MWGVVRGVRCPGSATRAGLLLQRIGAPSPQPRSSPVSGAPSAEPRVQPTERQREGKMRLAINDSWRERLQELRRNQAIAAEVEATLGGEAVWLYGWLGNSAHLGLDGRVVGWAAADGLPPEVVDDPEYVARLVTLGSRWLGLPELVELLPPMPPGHQVCPWCEGRRWDDTPYAGHPEGGVCLVCKGVGWRLPSWAEPSSASNPNALPT